MWMRWNDSTHIFEMSTNDGASWAVLPLNASVINEGSLSTSRLPGNIAYKDQDNGFVPQTFSANSVIQGIQSVLFFRDTTGVANNKSWTIEQSGGVIQFTARDDVNVSQGTPLILQRNGNFTINGNAGGLISITARNINSGTGAGTQFLIQNDNNTNLAGFYGLSSTYVTTAGFNVSASATIFCGGIGGLSLVAFHVSGNLRFYTAGANERMRIEANGQVAINTMSPIAGAQTHIAYDSSVNVVALYLQNLAGSNNYFQMYGNSARALAGAVQQTGATTVAFLTTSDERLKNDNGRAIDLSSLRAVIVHDFIWKDDNKKDRGIFAQESYELYPKAISQGKDDLTEDGTLQHPWMIDYSKFVPDLITGWQEHEREIVELKRLLNDKSSS